MKIRLHVLVMMFTLIVVSRSSAQDIPEVHFKSGKKVFQENAQEFATATEITSTEIVDGFYYRYVQFEDIPSKRIRDLLNSKGIRIIEYIPENTYLIALPEAFDKSQVLSFDIRSVVPRASEDKIDPRLLADEWPGWATTGEGQIKVMIKALPGISEKRFVALLKSNNVSFEKEDVHFPTIFTKLDPGDIERVARFPFIYFIDMGPNPGTPESTGGRTLQRANLIDNHLPNGLRYNGQGVSIQVRDDGVVGPHIDFKGRLIDYTGGYNSGYHGDGVAGVFAGAGNKDPEVKGTATGANIYVTTYESTFTDMTLNLHLDQDVMITNSSFGDDCNAGYTTVTQRVDQQMVDYPNLMHVFSAGNSNGTNCGYGAGNQWGNITGGHKQGKNVMAVANLKSDGTLETSSSRGPAHDGRIKPDISAHGQDQRSTKPNNLYQTFGGTSAAAPTMAGTLAQLYQAYRALNNNENPNSGLMKAIVLNSAFDMGNRGPDFKFGWGRIDAYRALQILENQDFLSASVAHAATNDHEINIPAGVAEAKMMLYWVDPAGAVNSSKALVNNLNARVIDPGSNHHLPWKLDHSADPNKLDLPATRGIDNLNNMEQVSIDNPSAGTYTFRVNGNSVPIGVQEYFVIWIFELDQMMITYPHGGESLIPGQIQKVHWDAFGDSGTFSLEYSTNGGDSWFLIENNINGSQRSFDWMVPHLSTGEGRIRIRRGSKIAASDDNFTIIGRPSILTKTNTCKSGMTLNWSAIPDADAYQVYQLGQTKMDPVAITSDLSWEFNQLEVGETSWFSVAAVTATGSIGRRANAISYFANPQFNSCPNTIDLDKSVSQIQANAGDNLMYTIDLTNNYTQPITNVVVTDILDPSWQYIENSLTCGTINDQLITWNQASIQPGQTVSCSFEVRSNLLEYSKDIFVDDLESGQDKWSIQNLEGTTTWVTSDARSNSSSASWFSPNVGMSNLQSITTEPIMLLSDSKLSFHHWFHTETDWDGGFVEISTDNGATWIDLGPYITLNGYNGNLLNGSNSAISRRAAFTGTSDGFIETIVDLSDFSGMVLVRFLFGEDSNSSEEGWYIDDVLLRSEFHQTNMACVSFDQGEQQCDIASTLMLPCLSDCDICMDEVQNGDETGVDCGGSLCMPCPCTQEESSLTFIDETIPDGTDIHLKSLIATSGDVLTAQNSVIQLRAGDQVVLNSGFTTVIGSTLIVNMEDCQD